MAKTLDEMMVGLSPERRERIEKRTAELIAEEHVRRKQRSRQARTKSIGPVRSNTLIQVPAHG